MIYALLYHKKPKISILLPQNRKSTPSTKIRVRIYRVKGVTAERVLVLIQVASLCSGMPLSRDGLCTGVALRATGRDMLLGESAAISVPLNSDAQHPAPRDADTAAALCLEVSSVLAVCEQSYVLYFHINLKASFSRLAFLNC